LKAFYKNSATYLIFFLFSFFIIISMAIYGQEEGIIEDSQVILALINEEVITLNDFNQYWDSIPDQYKVQLNKVDLLEQLIIQALLVQNTEEIGLKNNPEVTFQIKNTTDQILIQYLIEKEIVEKTEISEEEISSYYEEHKEDYWKEEEIHALNILTETEEQAMDVLKKLDEGTDFSVLAQEVSIASSASRGGDIGLISKGTLTPDIEVQLFVLTPGDISDIIPSEKGFHIFKIVDRISAHYIELDEIREEIRYQLLPQKQQQAFDQYLKDIEDRATIVKNLDSIKE
jgi:peptidyl-prolyl cis-trans isomerase C